MLSNPPAVPTRAPLRRFCDACQRPRPAVGFVQTRRYDLCTACASAYTAARDAGLQVTVGQFVRDARFGEAERYRLRLSPDEHDG